MEGARRAFERLGYQATRVEDILQEAGVSRPTFYRVFHNKEEVYAEISDGSVPHTRSARERVLEGAREAFGRLGYELTRVEDILEASGVSRPTFYRIFASKHDAYEQLDRIAVAYLRHAIEHFALEGESARDLLELTLASYIEWRVGLKLPFDGVRETRVPPGLHHARAELLMSPREGSSLDPLWVSSLLCALDALASSFVPGQERDPEVLGARRELATDLVVRLVGSR